MKILTREDTPFFYALGFLFCILSSFIFAIFGLGAKDSLMRITFLILLLMAITFAIFIQYKSKRYYSRKRFKQK
ncbi:MAG: hypothetical protein ACFFD4_22115 [Candidatus Odinarchaeota archaeon]